eukprot:Gb_24150 [translate_table: standard]
MVQGGHGLRFPNYKGGIDSFKIIIMIDRLTCLYRGFGVSIITYAPSNALASYLIIKRMVWSGLGYYNSNEEKIKEYISLGLKLLVVVQGLNVAMVGVLSSLVTTPLDTIKTRLQVLEEEENKRSSVAQSIKNIMKEGGLSACYRGFGTK